MTDIMNKQYIFAFFVGMMDGDGSIQVNHWRKKILQFRMVIKLKNTELNKEMLLLFEKNIGGHVKFVKNTNEILWVENHKKKILEILQIFDKYPCFTTKLDLQIKFLKKYIYTQTYTYNAINNKEKKIGRAHV